MGNESSPRVLFTRAGTIEQEIDQRIWEAGAVLRSLYRTVVTTRELSQKAKLWIYHSIILPSLIYGHEGWVMTEIQAVEMGFFRRLAGISLRERVRRSVIYEELGDR